MTKEKQIEGMANDLRKSEHWYFDDTDCDFELDRKKTAENLYNAGYRKQSEGEWIKTETNYTCSTCNFNVISWSGEYDGFECERSICLMKYCPNCGAKMQGGE